MLRLVPVLVMCAWMGCRAGVPVDTGTAADAGSADAGSTSDGSSNDGGTNGGGSADDGSADDGSTDNGSTDDGSTDDGSSDDGSSDDDSSDDDSGAGDGSTDDGSSNDGSGEDVPGDEDPPSAGGPSSAQVAILDSVPGWAVGTVGGRDGALYTVTTLASSGPGSLKEGLERDGALWIVFAPDINGVILMDTAIVVRSHKTVDARGHDITLRAENVWNTGLKLGTTGGPGVEHVVLLNLTFDGGWADYEADGEGDDGINIRNGAHHIWIHQCTFTRWIDGAIDGKVDAGFMLPHHVAITSSRFTQIFQPLLVAIDHLTFARNHCVDVGKRCIQLNDGAKGHMVNNVVEDWSNWSIIAAKDGAQLLVDHNIFKPGIEEHAGAALTEDTDVPGRWQGIHNHELGGNVSFMAEGTVDVAFKEATRATYTHHDCDNDDDACWADLYDVVTAEAGARP